MWIVKCQYPGGSVISFYFPMAPLMVGLDSIESIPRRVVGLSSDSLMPAAGRRGERLFFNTAEKKVVGFYSESRWSGDHVRTYRLFPGGSVVSFYRNRWWVVRRSSWGSINTPEGRLSLSTEISLLTKLNILVSIPRRVGYLFLQW